MASQGHTAQGQTFTSFLLAWVATTASKFGGYRRRITHNLAHFWPRRRARRKAGNPEPDQHTQEVFNLDFQIYNFSPYDALTVGQSHENIHIFGQVGSGKTTGSGRGINRAYLRAGYGMIYFVAKAGEFERIRKEVEACGRLHNLIRFAPDELDENGNIRWRLNFLAYEQQRPQRGAGLTRNIVKLFTTVQDALDRNESRNGGGSNPYFRQAGQQWMCYAVDLYLLARPGDPLSVGIIHEIILSSPANLEQVHNDEWLNGSLCNKLLDEALARKEQMTQRQQKDFDLIGKFWFREVPQLAPETRSSIISTFTVAADLFLRGNMAEMFGTTTTIVPEVTHEGGIVVFDMPLKSHGQEGLAAQILMKLMWEQATERRDVTSNRRSVCAWLDEAHLFVNEETVSFCTTAREKLASVVMLSQTKSNYLWALGGEDKGKSLVDTLMAVMGTKIFHASSDPVLNQFASDCFAKSWQGKTNIGKNQSDGGDKSTSSFGISEQLTHNVQPEEFLTLRKGGKENDYWVDAIVGQGGRIWNASGRTFLRTSFNQKGQ